MTKRMREDNQRVAFPIQLFDENSSRVDFAEADNLREIHVVPTGKWTHWSGYEIEITPETISKIVQYFRDGVRKDLPITAGHDFGQEYPAVGWFKDLIDKGANGLYALVDWNEAGMKLLKDKSYKYFSAELSFDFRDLETDKKYDVLLTGGALVNHPFFKQLDIDPSFGFSETEIKQAEKVFDFSVDTVINQFNDTNIMDLQTILAKDPSTWTDEEKAFVREHKAELTAEQAETHAEVIKDDGAVDETPEELATRLEKEKGDANEAAGLNRDGTAKAPEPEAPAPDVAASEKGQVTLSAAEHAALISKANNGQTAFTELEKMKVAERFSGMTFSASNPKGHFALAQKDAVIGFMTSLSETQRDQFVNIVNKMPELSNVFAEIGENGAVESDVAKRVELAVQAKIKESDNKMNYSDALKAVFAENASLETEYNESGA